MNIRPSDFVLEIGSGHNPKARADVLCDKFVADDEQRGGALVTDRPCVEADGQHLPFADKAFDYVICSHVLEHVTDPVQFISELERVASRGYIETPSEIGERLYGWHYHHWVVNLVAGRLLLRRNSGPPQFGRLFHRFAATDKHWKRFHLTHPTLFLVRYEWEDRINYELLPDEEPALDFTCPETLDRLSATETARHPWVALIKSLVPRGAVSRLKSLWVRGRRRPTKCLEDILVCPTCKGGVTWGSHRLDCRSCGRDYPIIDGIPRFTTAEPQTRL